MTAGDPAAKSIAIIGGGISGVLTAYHVTQLAARAQVTLIDPCAEPGPGLAYSTPSFRHLLNVPAGKISALPEQPNHFLPWLRRYWDASATPATFAPRAIYGQYIQTCFASTAGAEHKRTSVVDYQPLRSGALLTLRGGRKLRADYVVLATGNFDPAPLPGIGEEATRSGVYCNNPWTAATYDGINPDAHVTLIGSGLTAVDVLLRLRELGHRGPITAISRHGMLPKGHADYASLPKSVIPIGTSPTCLAYLRAFHIAIRNGVAWRAAVDSLRPVTNDLWLALPFKEQRRFRRHLQHRWDVVRHRMAPAIAEIVETELADGTLSIHRGRVVSVDAHEQGAMVTFRAHNITERLVTSRVINCTGPNMNYRRVNSPLLKSLFAQGLAAPGPLGAGFHCSRNGALIDADGKVSNTLFCVGPGRLGTLLESIAVPEIRQQAFEIASLLGDYVAEDIASAFRYEQKALSLIAVRPAP